MFALNCLSVRPETNNYYYHTDSHKPLHVLSAGKAVLILHHVVVSARAASACVRLEDTTMPHPLQLASMGFLD